MLQGYYSLIQYCPDWTRLEVCNIGVMLYCPEQKFLDVEMTRKNTRIRSIFGKNHSLDHVRMFKDSFAERIRMEKENLSGLDTLKKFIACRANSFRITEPRSIAVDDPKQELSALFAEIFDEISKSDNEKRVSVKERFYQALKKALGASLDQRVATKFPRIDVSIPGFHQMIQPCAGYLNGTFNLIVNRKLTPDNSFKVMSCDLLIGRFIHQKEDKRWGKQRLIILADTDNSSDVKKQINTFAPMLKEHETEVFTDPTKMARIINRLVP